VIPSGYTYTGKITFSSGSDLFVEGALIVGEADVPQMVYSTNELTIQPGGQFSITGTTAFSPSSGTLYNYGSMIAPLLSFNSTAKLVNKGTLTVNGSLTFTSTGNTFTNDGNASFGQFSVTNGTVTNNGVMTVEGFLYTNTAKLTNNNYLMAGQATTVQSTWYVYCGTYVTGVLLDESATIFYLKTGTVLNVGTFNASGSDVRMPSSSMMVAETVIFNGSQSVINGTGSKYALCRFGSVIPGNGSYLVVNYRNRVEIECSNHYQGTIWTPFYSAETRVRWAAEGHATTVIAPTSCNDDGNVVTPPYPTPANPGFPLEVPTASVYTFIMEDNWPAVADYDMNDLVVKFSLAYAQNSSNLVESMKITYTLLAVGAKKAIAAAIQLDEILPSQVNTITYGGGLALTGKIFPRQTPGLESGQARVVVPLFDDAHKVLNSGIVINTMLNTYTSAQKFTPVTNTIDIAFKTAVSPSLVNVMKLNFFIVPDGVQNAQTRTEIHLSGFRPSDKADATRFGKYYDNSVNGAWYTTPGNLVWGILVPSSFKYPTETTSIVKAYPDFAAWCTSGGAQHTSWYMNPTSETGLIFE
jgi:LruC domain-containing protein